MTDSSAANEKDTPISQILNVVRWLWRKSARLISVTLGIVAVGLIAYWTYLLAIGHDAWWLLVLIVIVIALLVPMRLFALSVRVRNRVASGWLMAEQRDLVHGLVSEAAAVSQQYSRNTFNLLVDMLVEPATFRARIKESIDLDRQRTSKGVTADIVIDEEQVKAYQKSQVPTPQVLASGTGNADASELVEDAASANAELEEERQTAVPERLLVPLMHPPKGRLYDCLRFSEGSGIPIISLPYERSLAAIVAAMLSLFTSAYDLSAKIDSWDERPRLAFLDLAELAALSASELGRAKRLIRGAAGSKPLEERLSDRIDHILADPPVDSDSLSKLKRVAKIATTHYVIVVDSPFSRSIQLEWSYELATRSLRRPAKAHEGLWLTRLVQHLLGVPSGYVEATLTRARRARSYHLYINVPGGSYFGPTHVYGPDDLAIEINPRPTLSVGEPYLRPITRQGSSIHIYGHHLSSILDRLRLRARVYERPTGTELYSTIGSLSLLMVSIVFLRLSRDAGVGTDVAAALLALPATFAAFGAFFSAAIRRSLILSSAGVVIGLMSGILGSAAIVLFVLQKSLPDKDATTDTWHSLWCTFVAISAGIAAFAVGVLILRSLGYRLSLSGHRLE